MMRIFFYLATVIIIVALIRKIVAANSSEEESRGSGKFKFRPKLTNRNAWVQVYDTDSLDEIKSLQARLEEEEIECFVYEQGRKDIHGNPLKGFGIVVPKTSVSQAQKIITRMPA